MNNFNQRAHEEPQFNFSIILVGIIIALVVYGCKGSQHLAITEHVTHDTLYLTNIRYDSIYIRNDHKSEYHLNPQNYTLGTQASRIGASGIHPDTLVVTKVSTLTKYKLLHDTIKIIRRDSIPYEVKVIETKTERYTPWYARLFAFVGFLLILWYGFKIIIRFIKR